MGKNKNKGKYQTEEEEDFGKKKKNIITQQLLMDKSNMDFTEFIPLLPEDVLYPSFKISQTSTKALLKIVTDLNYLLYLEPKNFWATVTYNISFGRCLSSCLSQLSVKWINKYQFLSEEDDEDSKDFNYRTVKDSDAYSYIEALQDVLLKIVFRIMSFQQEDPRLNQIYNFGQNTIKKLNVFNYIKMLELVQIYGQREDNHPILKAIARNFLRTLPNPYKYFTEQLLPHLIKKIEQNNREIKLVTDREEFGINYSYTRLNPKNLSPGEEELKRKVRILMSYISFMKLIKNTKLISEQILDHIYFNPQLHHAIQNSFYELDAAYKIWNQHGMEKRLLPMINHILVEVIEYFVEYFNRVDDRLVRRNSKTNLQAYARSLQRFFVDYGKRYSLGKKGASVRHMTLYKLIMKKVDLLKMLEQLYVDEQQNKTHDFNLQYFIDFKLALQDCWKEDNYINEDQARQHELQEETQIPDDLNVNDIDEEQKIMENPKIQNQITPEYKKQDQKLEYVSPANEDHLEFLVSKKSREDDYYEQLYLKQKQKFKIQYEDEYDDLVDYDKRPLFMDSASSDSDTEEVHLQRLVSNENNQKANQLKHIKFEEKQKERKKKTKYTKVTQEQKQSLISKDTTGTEKQQGERQKQDGKSKYVLKQRQKDTRIQKVSAQDKPKYVAKQKYVEKQKEQKKPKTNQLETLLEQQKMPGDAGDQDYQEQERARHQDGRGGYEGKRRYVPNNKQDNKTFNQKGRNSNKNKQYGNATNQAFGGGKKYKQKY